MFTLKKDLFKKFKFIRDIMFTINVSFDDDYVVSVVSWSTEKLYNLGYNRTYYNKFIIKFSPLDGMQKILK